MKSVRRLLMDFSGSLEDRSRTVMVRSNNGQVELVVKTGGIADTQRSEGTIKSSSSLEEVLNAVAMLGFIEASYGLREMLECEIDGMEYSIRKIIDIENPAKVLGINFEVELMREGSKQELRDFLEGVGLSPLDKDQTKSLFRRLHEEANKDYVHSEQAAKELSTLVTNWLDAIPLE